MANDPPWLIRARESFASAQKEEQAAHAACIGWQASRAAYRDHNHAYEAAKDAAEAARGVFERAKERAKVIEAARPSWEEWDRENPRI